MIDHGELGNYPPDFEDVWFPEAFDEFAIPTVSATPIYGLYDFCYQAWPQAKVGKALYWKYVSDRGGLIQVDVSLSTSPDPAQQIYVAGFNEWNYWGPGSPSGFEQSYSVTVQPGIPFFIAVRVTKEAPVTVILRVSDYAGETVVIPSQTRDVYFCESSHQVPRDPLNPEDAPSFAKLKGGPMTTRGGSVINSYLSAPGSGVLSIEREHLWRPTGLYLAGSPDDVIVDYHGSLIGPDHVSLERVTTTEGVEDPTTNFTPDAGTAFQSGPYAPLLDSFGNHKLRPLGPPAEIPETFWFTGIGAGGHGVVKPYTAGHQYYNCHFALQLSTPELLGEIEDSDEDNDFARVWSVPAWRNVPDPEYPDVDPTPYVAMFPWTLRASLETPYAAMSLNSLRDDVDLVVEIRAQDDPGGYDDRIGFANIFNASWTFDHTEPGTQYEAVETGVGFGYTQELKPLPSLIFYKNEYSGYPYETGSIPVEISQPIEGPITLDASMRLYVGDAGSSAPPPVGYPVAGDEYALEDVEYEMPLADIDASVVTWQNIPTPLFSQAYIKTQGPWPRLLIATKPKALEGSVANVGLHGGDDWNLAVRARTFIPRVVRYDTYEPELPEVDFGEIDGAFDFGRARFS